ncbi:MAG: TatD family hydrolase [Clostridiales bacterium]|jgi:TatD DNase family protein|nr:TatD family hydrolase [Clostridiales bacterium]
MLIDTHAHLCDPVFGGGEDIVASMAADGLDALIAVSYDMPSSRFSSALAKKHKNVYCAVGIHPSNTKDFSTDFIPGLLALTKDPKCVAVGEIGLDYHYPDTDKAAQAYALDSQVELAAEAALPVIFHVRDAYADMYAALKRNVNGLKRGAVMHCFSGTAAEALSYIDLGFYVSFSGTLTFKNAKSYPEIIAAVPRERVLIETDCPYLAPHPYRGQTNYPRYVRLVAEKLAALWGTDFAEAARVTADNAKRLFGGLK